MFNGMNGLEILKNWPRYEDSEPVRIGDEYADTFGANTVATIEFGDGYSAINPNTPGGYVVGKFEGAHGRYVPRPAPKVLDADGVEIRVGDTVYYVDGREQKVNTVARLTDGLVQFVRINEAGYVTYCEGACISPDQLTHRAPVFAADGKPLREGETVWDTKGNGPYIIDAIEGDVVVRIKGNDLDYFGADFTHERPDSWERIEEDAGKVPCDYFGFDGEETCGKCPASGKNCEQTMARDLVRRCRALAERERGE